SESIVGISGSTKLHRKNPLFIFDLSLFSPDTNKTYLSTYISGNEKGNFISAALKMNENCLPAFFGSDFDVETAFEMEIKGSWVSWNEFIRGEELTHGPLLGMIKGKISPRELPSQEPFLNFLNQGWKFKTQFSLLSENDISLENLLVLSDLIHLKGKAKLRGSYERSSLVLAFSTPDLSTLQIPFHLRGNSKGKISFEKGDFQLSFETQNLFLDCFKAGTLRGIIDGTANRKAWIAHAEIDSSDAAIPFDCSFNLELVSNDTIALNDFVLTAAASEIQGNLNYRFPEKLYDGKLIAKLDQLEELGAFTREKRITGEITAELSLSSDSGGQDLQCALVGNAMRYHTILLDDLSVYAEFENLFQSPRGKFNVLLEKVYTPGFYLNSLTFGTQSDEMQWPFYFDAEGRIENPFECSAKGFWRKDISLFTLELTRFFGTLAETSFALKHPCELEWGADYLNLSPIDFRIGQGTLFSTFELSPVRSLGQWELKHFPLEILSCFKPRFALIGAISSSGYIDAAPDNMHGVFHAVLEEADLLHFGKKEPFQAKGSIQAHLNQGTLQVHTVLNATDEQFLDFSATLPTIHKSYPLCISLDKTKKTSAELLAEGKLQDLFDFMNMGTNNLTGWLSCHLFLSETLSTPLLKGNLELQKGTYENYFTGIELRQIHAQFEAEGDAIRLISLKANDDESGEVNAIGKILLQPEKKFPYAFEAEMKELHAVGFDMIDCDLTGPLYLTGNLNTMDAQGNFLVDAARIQVTERLPYEIPSMPVTYINTPVHLTPRSGPDSKFEFKMDLEVTSEGNVRVEGSGLNAELEGDVHLYGTNTNILADGALKLIKGEYVFAGKIFKLTEGEVLFSDKPTPSAYLHLNGTLNLPSITVTAMLRGPLTSPQLTFQSNPQKPTSTILALILFNKDISEISHPEAIQLASTLVSLSGGAGPDVLESIRKSIGIDRLNISSNPGSDELAVQIGKYLNRGIMIT